MIGDVDDVDVGEVTHLLVGGEVAAAAVVVDDDALERFGATARKTLAASEKVEQMRLKDFESFN